MLDYVDYVELRWITLDYVKVQNWVTVNSKGKGEGLVGQSFLRGTTNEERPGFFFSPPFAVDSSAYLI